MGVFTGAHWLSVALPSGFYSSSESTILVRLVQRYNTRRANRDYNQFLMPKPELFGVPIFPLPSDQQIAAMHKGVWPQPADPSIQQFGDIASYLGVASYGDIELYTKQEAPEGGYSLDWWVRI